MSGAGQRALVTFAIPVRRPVSAADRARIDEVLAMTLRSIYAQTDEGFRIVAAMSHEPALPAFVDYRFEILRVGGWRPVSWDDANAENGNRRYLLARRFAEQGGGYLMFCDADDFVSRNLVAHVRSTMEPHGYAVWQGYVFDAAANVIAPYPVAASEANAFHHFCGTSLIVRLTPDDVLVKDAAGRTFYERTHCNGHPKVDETMKAAGRPLARIPFPAVVYVRNSGENLSRLQTDAHEEKKREGLRNFHAWILEQRLADDRTVRAEFSLPPRYPLAQPADVIQIPPALPSAPTLSVVICTHRRPKGLERLLTALVPQVAHRPSREIVVVNDGTHDEAYSEVVSRFVANIRYRALKQNTGIANARNTAAAMAMGEYLVFTDDDCEPPPFWLDWLQARLAEHPELDVFAGTTRPLPPDRPTFFAHVRAVHELIPTTASTDGTIIFPTAVVAVRRSLFEQLGGFGFPGFEGAGEDTELATRLSLRGAVGAYDPAWFTRHEVSEGFFGLCRRYRRYGYANARLTGLTTSPVAHDFMLESWKADWRTIWRWEYEDCIDTAREAHDNRLVATASAVLACLVKMAYWRGVKDAFRNGAVMPAPRGLVR